ncbi:sushi, von Willebrand factor type A, EGF and pentraxin domain-containing protein 1-like [Dreissena polymorpha]|uniref:sushi, von Willebrand factor type A, EGF and pentraxin domain-containing protein 1-like n=1 Tax=Dreissena polymorpha TaxID=45954 RepID=UPI0022645573|nr:sushi, von Willebrand factor type A, EGF and pentraxin domain-containing protein 1-like [Dreissena polymorpha]
MASLDVANASTYLSTSSITCDTGYLTSIDVIICQSDDCLDPTPSNGQTQAPKGTTYGEVAFVSCDVGYTLVGDRFIGCLASGNWSHYPTCVLRDCADPTPVYGSSNYSSSRYGTVVQVTCHPGYEIGGSALLICLSSGMWDHVSSCVPADCGDPTPDHGTAVYTVTTLGASVNYTCDAGYDLVGSATSTCTATGWYTTPQCIVKDCGAQTVLNGTLETPGGTKYGAVAIVVCDTGFEVGGDTLITYCKDPKPVNGHSNATTFQYGSVVEINCSAGYNLSGRSVITCGEYGVWSENPICDPSDCGNPTPKNGIASYTDTTLDAVALLSCNDGYNNNGKSVIECLTTGKWNESANCTIKDCSDPSPLNGDVNVTNFEFATVVNVSCSDGYTVVGTAEITCGSDGTWTDNPVCDPLDCGEKLVSNGYAESPSGTKYGAVAIVICHTGYEVGGDTLITCRENGTWGGEALCNITYCKNPTPVNGNSNTTTFEYGSVVEVNCVAGYNITGPSVITCEEYGKWSDNPTCAPSDCSDPSPLNGDVNVTTFEFGTVANVSCSDGYTIVGTAEITCGSDGTWTDNPVCDPLDCGEKLVSNGYAESPSGTKYGAVAIVICHTGYEVGGDTLITCRENGTWSDEALCNITYCKNPTPVNGNSNTTTFEYGSVVEVNCVSGYNITGPSVITCEEYGKWSDNPTCDPSDCSDPSPLNGDVNVTNFEFATVVNTAGKNLYPMDCSDPSPLNGDVNVTTFEFGTVANVSCSDGYTIVGTAEITCGSDGTWTDNPVCDPLDCGEKLVSNGYAESPSGTKYGAVAIVICHTGYEVGGDTLITCRENGTWSDEALCNITYCKNPTPVNGNSNTTTFEYGSVVEVNCVSGYNITGPSVITCEEYGKWSDNPTCDPSDCSDPSPLNGDVNVTTFEFGTVANVSCSDGYTIVGTAEITCGSDGTWTDNPVCDPLDCGEKLVSNGYAESPSGTKYGAVAIVICHTGYEVGGDTLITCRENGTWSDEALCNITYCKDPKPVNGNSNTTTFEYGSVVEVNCVSGYSITGPSVITCEEYGKWSDNPTCDPSDCGEKLVSNGYAESPSGTKYGAVAIVICHTGYEVGGDTLITCRENGTWSDEALCNITCPSVITCEEYGKWSDNPTCDPSDCSDPSPLNGDVNVTTFEFGTVANVSCSDGYTIVGTAEITCGSDGTWTDNPVCDPLDCGEKLVSNGYAESPSGTKYGAVAIVICHTGYEVGGDTLITCRENGTWSDEALCNITCPSVITCEEYGKWSDNPTCDPSDCSDPSPLNGDVNVTTFEFGTVANVSCSDGYTIVGTAEITCGSDGTWTDNPVCDPLDCGEKLVSNGYAESPSGTKYGAVAIVICHTGYEVGGDTLITCRENGTWSDEALCNITCPSVITCEEYGKWSDNPTCDPSDCSDPSPLNGDVNVTTFEFGTVANVSCSDGYTIVGTAEITCGSDGTWTDNPVCDPLDCGEKLVSNGYAESPSGTKYGAVAIVICHTGYEVGGDTLITCRENGTWSDEALCNITCPSVITCEEYGKWSDNPTCDPSDCSDPSPLNGDVNVTTFEFGTVANVSCSDGYTIVGTAEITCGSDGTWTDNPVCDPLDCGEKLVSNGYAESPSGTKYGAVAIVICHTGYEVGGDTLITCRENGTWSDEALCNITCPSVITCEEYGKWSDNPTCDPSDCSDPSPLNGDVNVTTFEFGTVANVSCSDGYTIVGTAEITCGTDGTWTDNPVCDPLDCGEKLVSNGYAESPSGTKYGAVAIVICHTGYEVGGETLITCRENGTWSDEALCNITCPSVITCEEYGKWSDNPTCDPSDCSDPSPLNGDVNVTTFEFGTVANTAGKNLYPMAMQNRRVALNMELWPL